MTTKYVLEHFKLAEQANSIQSEVDLTDIKNKVRQLSRRINRNSEPQASIESDRFNIQYVEASNNHTSGS
jgi:vesicle transport protein SEC22